MPERIFKHPLSISVLVVCYWANFSGSCRNGTIEYLVDIIYKQADDRRHAFCFYRFQGFKPGHGFVQVEDSTVYFQLRHVNAAVVVAKDKMLCRAELCVKVDGGRAVG